MADIPQPSRVPWGQVLPWLAVAGLAYLAWRTIQGAGNTLANASGQAVAGIGGAFGEIVSPLAVPVIDLATGEAWRKWRQGQSLAEAQRQAFGVTLEAWEIRQVARILSGESVNASPKVRAAASFYARQKALAR